MSSRRGYDAVLVDIDHSPRDLLHPDNATFYEVDGLKALSGKLAEGGVFALWSTHKPDDEFLQRMEQVFARVEAHEIAFDNPYQDGLATNTIYKAVKR